MPSKILRLGMTEISLLFIYWLKKYKNYEDNDILDTKKNLIKWLYTTSGYYDKTISGSYFDSEHKNNIDTVTYNTYMETAFNFIKNSDHYQFAFHQFSCKDQLEEFKMTINPKSEGYLSREILFDFIKNKRILIVSPFSPLIKQQIISGNCKKIYDDMPEINNIDIYKFPYSFFNKGPKNTILESANSNFNMIINTIGKNYDSVVISCGAYSILIAEKFYNIGKNVCTVGGELQTFFGILNTRTKLDYTNRNLQIKNKEYWILTIPDEYKPKDYMKIEDGCYW